MFCGSRALPPSFSCENATSLADGGKISLRYEPSTCHLERSEAESKICEAKCAERANPRCVSTAEISYDDWIAFERKVNIKISLRYDV